MCSLFCQREVRHGLLLSALCPAAMVGWKEQRATHEELPSLGKLKDPYCHDLCSGNCLAQASAC